MEDEALQEMFAFETMTEVPAEEKPIETPVSDEPKVEETSVVEVPVVETPAVETPTVETPSVEDELRAEIARLSGMLTSGKLTEGTQQVFPPKEEAPKVETPTTQTQPQGVDPAAALKALLSGDLLSTEELDAVIDKPELLNEAYKRANTTLVDNLFKALPAMVNEYVTKEIQVNKLVTTFYEMHPDLRPYADFVRLNMGEIERTKPQATYKEIFEETATQCRKRLGLKELAGATPDGKPRQVLPAAFAGSKSNSTKVPLTEKKEFFDSNAADLFGDLN